MSQHVCIIGGGVIGLCSAYEAVRRGFRVTVVERNGEQRDGCSYGNAGMIVPSHMVPLAAPGMVALGLKWMWNPESPFYIKPRCSWDLFSWGWKFWQSANKEHVARSGPILRDLHLASRRCYEEFAEQWGDSFSLVKRGLLMLCKTQATLDEEAHAAEMAKKWDVPADVLTPAQAAAIDPDVTMNIAGAVHFPLDCHLAPQQFMAQLQQHLQQRGTEFKWATKVTGWKKSGDKLTAVKTSRGEIAADEFVLCGGSWSPQTVRELGLKLPMQAGKGYSLTLDKPRQLPQLCSIFTEARVAVTPMNGQLRFGGTMEIAGLDESITVRRVQGIIRSVPNYFTAFRVEDFAGITPWQGLRPCSPDGMPYIGRTRAAANLVIANGHAMMGLSLGPITGKLVGQVLANETPVIDLRLLRPDRFG
jgi:D-amino-acid dehydrogenase